MKLFIALLLIAVASANITIQMPAIHFPNITELIHEIEEVIESLPADEQAFIRAIEQYFKNLNVTVNYTDLALGANQQFGIVTDANGLACAATVLPTVEDLQTVLSTIENFQFAMTFENIKPLIAVLTQFDDLCEPAYMAYAEYFLAADEAYQANKNVFVHAALENLLANKEQTMSLALELSTQIGANDDTSAGQTLAKLIQLALSTWLPQ